MFYDSHHTAVEFMDDFGSRTGVIIDMKENNPLRRLVTASFVAKQSL